MIQNKILAMKKIVFFSITFLLIGSYAYSQLNSNISIKVIRNHVNTLAKSLKSEGQLDNMFINLDENGNRWLYIEDKSMDGLRSDEGYLSLKISKVILTMLYHSLSYNQETTISLKDFTNILLAKSIKGVEFKTHNNDFFFTWKEILEFDPQ